MKRFWEIKLITNNKETLDERQKLPALSARPDVSQYYTALSVHPEQMLRLSFSVSGSNNQLY